MKFRDLLNEDAKTVLRSIKKVCDKQKVNCELGKDNAKIYADIKKVKDIMKKATGAGWQNWDYKPQKDKKSGQYILVGMG